MYISNIGYKVLCVKPSLLIFTYLIVSFALPTIWRQCGKISVMKLDVSISSSSSQLMILDYSHNDGDDTISYDCTGRTIKVIP